MSAQGVFLAAESMGLGRGGVSRVARLTAKVLSELAHERHLPVRGLALNDKSAAADLGVPIRTAGGSRSRFVFEVQKAAWRHSHFIYDFLGMARAHAALAWLRRPCMCYICGIEVWEETAPNRIRAARRTDWLVSITHYTRERADSLYGGFDRAHVCWLGTEADEPPPTQVNHSSGPPTVLILARIDELMYKGHPELVACWPRVVSAVPDARLLIVGGGPNLVELRRLAAASPAAQHIEVMGFVPEENMESVWARTHVFAMPSRGEGFGLVYIEAMRHGVPVVASIHDAAPEINLHGQTGFNVDLERTDDLPDRLIELLSNPDRALVLGANGRQRWREHFCYSAFRDRFMPLLRRFIEETP